MYHYFEQLIDPLRSRETTRPPVRTLAFFWYFIQPIKTMVLVTMLLAGIGAICEMYLYTFLGWILDWMADTAREDFLATHGSTLVAMAMVAGVVRPVASLGTRAMIGLALAPGLTNTTRWQNHRYVLGQSMAFFQNDFAGRISQKVMQTGNALREAVLNVVDGAWVMIIYLVVIVVLFVDINTQLLWPIAVWVLAYGVVIGVMVPPVRLKSASLSEATSGLTGRVVDSYTNIQSVKLFAHHELEADFAATGIRIHTRAFRVLMRAILNMTVALTVLNTALILGTAALSTHLWLQNSISVGEITIANTLIIRLNQMSGWVLRTITSLFENIGTVQNGIETISRPTAISDEQGAADLQVTQGALEFDAVSFRYEELPAERESLAINASQNVPGQVNQISIIDDCSFNVAPGEKIGLVGRSGAGKSTLINLLMRFHDLQRGAIRIDGQDIRHLTQSSLRSNIAVVTQDTSLLHRSIRDNIRYGRADATEEQIVQAAELAEAMGFIPGLFDRQGRSGLDAFVGERGVKLSGGQRQRIAIARVILKNAPILILDEATSALDSEVEAAIQEQLNNLMQDKTVLAVAHRLSTIAALDRLIVLDEGRIIETGNHAELLLRDGLYARLWHRQSGGFLGI